MIWTGNIPVLVVKELIFWTALTVGVLCVVGGVTYVDKGGDGSPAIIFGVVLPGCVGLPGKKV